MANDNKPAHERQDNTNTEHADQKEMKKVAREGVVTEEREDVGGRKVLAESRDPSKIKGVGSTLGLAPGATVTVTLASGREVPANVVNVHPGRAANEEVGIQEEKPSLDLKAFDGNPDTGGTTMLYGVPVSSVTAQATLR